MEDDQNNLFNTSNLLRNDLEALRYLNNYPNLYLYDYFSDLRRQVDLAAAMKLLKAENIPLIDNYMNIIDKINSFEDECTKRLVNDEFSDEIKASSLRIIESIEYEFKTTDNLQDIKDSIYDEAYKLKKILFSNQTIEFIQKDDCLIKNWFSDINMDISVGKLLIINSQFFDKKGLSLITKYLNIATLKFNYF